MMISLLQGVVYVCGPIGSDPTVDGCTYCTIYNLWQWLYSVYSVHPYSAVNF